MSERVRTLLVENLRIDPEDVYVIDGPLGTADLMELHRLNRPELKDTPFTPRTPPALRGSRDIFAVIQQGDILLHHPYDNFGTIVEFLQQAAFDPQVLAIK